MTTYKINTALNGIEITFAEKPADDIRTSLKAAGFRWHKVKKVWYAKQTTDRLTLAASLAEFNETTPEAKSADFINLDNLGENKPHLYRAELAAAIREDLKRRGVKGVSVRARKVTHETGITVTIKATADDIASIEEMKERYNYSHFTCCNVDRGFYDGEQWVYNFHELTDEQKQDEYNKYIRYQLCKVSEFSTHWNARKNCPELTTAFYDKCLAVFRIANQWNYNNSDIMTDYFDIGYFLDIDIKKPDGFIPRENMTVEERKAYEEEQRQEEEERAAAYAKYEQEQEEARKASEAYEAKRKVDRATIADNITVVDLDKPEQLYITNLKGGAGKEATLKELHESQTDRREEALITRKVIFTDPAALATFGEYLLDDFDFLEGKGGTASEDIRLENVKALYNLTTEQRESVKWFLNDCIAVYLNDELKLVCDPEGYNYSRYTFEPTDASEILSAKQETDEQRKASEILTPFYFPAPVEEQAKALNIGDQITVYQCDGWILNSIYAGAGTVTDITAGDYAQYKGVYITLDNKKRVFIRDNHDCLIYKGIKPALPAELTREKLSSSTGAVMYKMLNYNELFPIVLDYYSKQGEAPIIDTIQR